MTYLSRFYLYMTLPKQTNHKVTLLKVTGKIHKQKEFRQTVQVGQSIQAQSSQYGYSHGKRHRSRQRLKA